MNSKSIKLKRYFQENNINFFDFRSVGDIDIFEHTENVEGAMVLTFIATAQDDTCTEVRFALGNCRDKIKQERIILFLNELNCQNKLKYFLDDASGAVYACFHYWSTNEDFNPKEFFSLFVMFFQGIIQNGDIRKIMKIIWS